MSGGRQGCRWRWGFRTLRSSASVGKPTDGSGVASENHIAAAVVMIAAAAVGAAGWQPLQLPQPEQQLELPVLFPQGSRRR